MTWDHAPRVDGHLNIEMSRGVSIVASTLISKGYQAREQPAYPHNGSGYDWMKTEKSGRKIDTRAEEGLPMEGHGVGLP
jgi:hypothetical protein